MAKHKFKGERTASTLKIAGSMIVFLATVSLDFWIGSTLIVAAVSAMAVYEFIKAFGAESKLLFGVSCAISALIPVYVGCVTSGIEVLPILPAIKSAVILSFYALVMLTIAVILHEKIKYVHAVAAFFGSLAIPFSLSCFLMMSNITYFIPSMCHYDGIYLVFMVFGVSWLTDVFAFLVGRKLGKHKMCPKISPKKSVEGAIGGVVIMTALVLFVTFVFDMVAKTDYVSGKFGMEAFLYPSNIKYLFVALFAIILSIISMFGDLAASVLKRNAGIKDFSNILPGHGGIIDRFDSTLFVLPVMFGMTILTMG